MRYRGPGVLPDGKTTCRIYSIGDLLLSEEQISEGQKPRVDPAVFKDTIVFVGISAAGLHDVFMTPLGNTGKIPGTQIHAAVTDQLLAGRTIRPVAALPQTAVVFAGAWIVSVLILLLPMRYDAIGAGLPAAGITVAGVLAVRARMVAVADRAVFRDRPRDHRRAGVACSWKDAKSVR